MRLWARQHTGVPGVRHAGGLTRGPLRNAQGPRGAKTWDPLSESQAETAVATQSGVGAGAAAVVTRGSRQGAGAGPGAQDAGTARGSSALCSAMPTSGDQGAVG